MTNNSITIASMTNKETMLETKGMTWDEATFTWDEAQGTWNDPYGIRNNIVNTASMTNQALTP